MAETSGDKTQDATPHRREQARKEGQVAQSQDLGSAVLLMAAVLALMSLGPAVMRHFGRLMGRQLGGEAWLVADRSFLLGQWNAILQETALVVLPIFGALFLSAIGVSLMQVGFLFVPSRITPDLSRISLLKGLGRLFSLASVMRVTFGIFKVLIVAAVALTSLYFQRDQIIGLADLAIGQIALYVSEIVLWTVFRIGMALLILALLDFAYQKWKHSQDLKMSSQEIREEMKNLQGDPQILARRRAVQRQLVLNRLGDAVPKADVVITNPTELAIAVQYLPDEMAAPIVVAKGAGQIAARIRQLALENNIPVVEKKPLAQALYKQVEIGHPIPSDLYAAIAEVLAYVYQLQGKEIPSLPN